MAPAGNAGIAIEAIKHGADAVYIGAPSHGARHAAANSLDDIKSATDYAHIYGAKVYVTVNTLVYENEIRQVERMIGELYRTGVDALIVQDMGILRMEIPPIALHASTQCDIRTPEKAKFLEEAGFSQLVLARELSLAEIREIAESVKIPVEVFIHGALCVSYSGRCSAGYACAKRSGNRGECPQICRQAFTLRDAAGKVIAKEKYLLSLKDLRAEDHIEELIEAGASSFKIEGRLKEAGYVKNVVAYYSRLLDEIIAKRDGQEIERASKGTTTLTFTPDLGKSFNRGYTDYRLSGAPDKSGIASIRTPKSLGEKITDLSQLRAGDGISYFDQNGDYTGVQFNGFRGNPLQRGKAALLLRPQIKIPEGTAIYRTSSIEWKKLMAGETARRQLRLEIAIDETGVTAKDETGAMVRLPLGMKGEQAQRPTDYRKIFEKTGNTPFRLESFESRIESIFYPASAMTALRRELIEKLTEAKKTTYKYDYRGKENKEYPYPGAALDYRDNVANTLAEKFYRDHGVEQIEPALERMPKGEKRGKGLSVMTTKHCILRELGLCLKNSPKIKMPLTLESGKLRFEPRFDCKRCEMEITLK